VIANFAKRTALLGLVASAMVLSGCGDVSQGRSPAQVVVLGLEAAPGATPNALSPTLLSDVITDGTTYNDVGSVTMEIHLKDPGTPAAPTSPSSLNAVTITRYHVSYVRSDGRNTEGVDVPYAFDSALTFTIPSDGTVTAGFELVRHSAKVEAPLVTLKANNVVISTIARVTFYGRDLAGNDVTVSAQIGIDFGDFADPS
jgi:hypothetical protein